jgi:hypothetical protein
MSAVEMYLKEAKTTKGTWHKQVIANLRDYIEHTPERDIISAINQIKDATLLPILWEVGLSQTLQDVANKRSMTLAGKTTEGVI